MTVLSKSQSFYLLFLAADIGVFVAFPGMKLFCSGFAFGAGVAWLLRTIEDFPPAAKENETK